MYGCCVSTCHDNGSYAILLDMHCISETIVVSREDIGFQ